MGLEIELIALLVIIIVNSLCHIPLIYGQYVKADPAQKMKEAEKAMAKALKKKVDAEKKMAAAEKKKEADEKKMAANEKKRLAAEEKAAQKASKIANEPAAVVQTT